MIKNESWGQEVYIWILFSIIGRGKFGSIRWKESENEVSYLHDDNWAGRIFIWTRGDQTSAEASILNNFSHKFWYHVTQP